MSVLIASDDTYQKVAASIYWSNDLTIQKQALALGQDGVIEQFERLRQANYDSYKMRYSPGEQLVVITPLVYVMTRCDWTKAQTLKSLEFIRYQIEIDHFDFSFIDSLITRLKNSIVESIPEYHLANPKLFDSLFIHIVSSLHRSRHWLLGTEMRALGWDRLVREVEGLRKAYHDSYMERTNIQYEMQPVYYFWNASEINSILLLKVLQELRKSITLDDFYFEFVDTLIDLVRFTIIEPIPEYAAANWG